MHAGEGVKVGREGGGASTRGERVHGVVGDIEPRGEGPGVGEGSARRDDPSGGVRPSKAGEDKLVGGVEGV